ncbi:MAG: TIGR00725 family protein [Chloroflexota bacterium]
MLEKKRLIAVIGGSHASRKEIKTAEDVGRELAKRGAAIVCGGLGGVMEAACRGASSEGGITIGILPGENRNDANQYVQISIVTGIGYARNVAVVKSAQAVIAIGGSYGTLSEIGHAIQSGIPVIGIDTWSLSKGGKINSSIIPAENAADAVGKAFDLIVD